METGRFLFLFATQHIQILHILKDDLLTRKEDHKA